MTGCRVCRIDSGLASSMLNARKGIDDGLRTGRSGGGGALVFCALERGAEREGQREEEREKDPRELDGSRGDVCCWGWWWIGWIEDLWV